MRRSRQIGRRLVRGAASTLLAGSLLLVAPQAAMAKGRPAELPAAAAANADSGQPADRAEGPDQREESENNDDRGKPEHAGDENGDDAADQRGEHAAGPADDSDPQADENSDPNDTAATPAAADSQHEGQQPTTNQAGSNDDDQSSSAAPAPQAADTAHVASSAPRTPVATAEAVTATTLTPTAAPDVNDIEAADPAPLSTITAAGEIEAAPDAETTLGATHSGVSNGIPIDPLVPASLGLLLLARVLWRPSPENRTYEL